MGNPTAVITGAARRLGRAMSLELAGRGYDIVAHYNHSSGDAEQLADEIRAMGRRCRLFRADFSDPDSVEETAKRLFEKDEEYRVLINNASVFNRALFRETDAGILARYFTIHVTYPFFLTKYFAAQSKRGIVVNILDSRVMGDNSDYFPYTLSKKTLASFTRMAANDLAPDIRVNAVCPGPVLPPGFENHKSIEQKAATLPLQKVVDVSDILKALNYLLDNDSVTGEFLFVDGGMHLINI